MEDRRKGYTFSLSDRHHDLLTRHSHLVYKSRSQVIAEMIDALARLGDAGAAAAEVYDNMPEPAPPPSAVNDGTMVITAGSILGQLLAEHMRLQIEDGASVATEPGRPRALPSPSAIVVARLAKDAAEAAVAVAGAVATARRGAAERTGP